jgi:hypothetical protein
MKNILFLVCVLVSAQLFAQQGDKNGSATFMVIDQAGKEIGTVIGVSQLGNVATVAFSFRGKPLPILVARSTFQQNTLLFTSTDCTGQPFQDASSSPFLMTTVSGSSSTLFAESGPSQSITAQSGLDPVAGCFQTSIPLSEAVPMSRVIDLNVFTPPFSVVSKGKDQ